MGSSVAIDQLAGYKVEEDDLDVRTTATVR